MSAEEWKAHGEEMGAERRRGGSRRSSLWNVTKFPSGEEPKVLTSVSDHCKSGNCRDCPGLFNLEEYGGQPIFLCTTATER